MKEKNRKPEEQLTMAEKNSRASNDYMEYFKKLREEKKKQEGK